MGGGQNRGAGLRRRFRIGARSAGL